MKTNSGFEKGDSLCTAVNNASKTPIYKIYPVCGRAPYTFQGYNTAHWSRGCSSWLLL